MADTVSVELRAVRKMLEDLPVRTKDAFKVNAHIGAINRALQQLSKGEKRHSLIAKAVYETVVDHAATWDEASEELVFLSGDPECGKVSKEHLDICCTRFPQFAERLRDYAERWNSDQRPTPEEIEAVMPDITEEELARGARQAKRIMDFYDKLRAVEKERDGLKADATRLDALEIEANSEPLTLHDGEPGRILGGTRGLGLKGTGRSIRKAIDDMVGLSNAMDLGTRII